MIIGASYLETVIEFCSDMSYNVIQKGPAMARFDFVILLLMKKTAPLFFRTKRKVARDQSPCG